MLQLHLSDQQFYCLLGCGFYQRFVGNRETSAVVALDEEMQSTTQWVGLKFITIERNIWAPKKPSKLKLISYCTLDYIRVCAYFVILLHKYCNISHLIDDLLSQGSIKTRMIDVYFIKYSGAVVWMQYNSTMKNGRSFTFIQIVTWRCILSVKAWKSLLFN